MSLKKLLIALLLAALCLMSAALAEPLDAFRGVWGGEDITVTFQDRVEDEDLRCRMIRDAGEDLAVLEYDNCWYSQEDEALFCVCCTRYREHVNLETMEIEQLDWSLDDMEFAYYALSEDGEAIIGSDIPGIDGTLKLWKLEDE